MRAVTTMRVSELARNLGRVLKRLEHEGGEIVITRNRRPVARLVSMAPIEMKALDAFADLYGVLPEEEGEAWLKDIEEFNGERRVE